MGQYWIPVNLDKREYFHPHRIGSGMKLWELVRSHAAGSALLALLAAEREYRASGDLFLDGPAAEVVGRWAGDRVALVGDYAAPSDLPPALNADLIHLLCAPSPAEELEMLRQQGELDRAARLEEELRRGAWRDISDLVVAFLEAELGDYLRELEQARDVYLDLLECFGSRERLLAWIARRLRGGASPPRHI